MTKEAFCSVGLLSLAEKGVVSNYLGECGNVLADIIRDQYPERVGAAYAADPIATIVKFNDHNDTTFADVERVFEKAEVAWDERV